MDNLDRLTKIFEMNFPEITVPFTSEPKIPEFLIKWIAPNHLDAFCSSFALANFTNDSYSFLFHSISIIAFSFRIFRFGYANFC